MLKVIIADDEKIQREGIAKHISWHAYNMELAGCAVDGVEALEMVKLHSPDILITDVKMPKIGGLELAQKAKELIPNIKILIVSGYEEFDYARAAIELNAHAYILKPINIGKLRQELERIGSICRSERQVEEEIAGMRKQLQESKPLLFDKFIKDMLYGFLRDENTIEKRAAFLSVSLPVNGYYVMLIQVDDSFEDDAAEEKRQLFYLNFSNYLAEICGKYGGGIPVQCREAEFVLILFKGGMQDEQMPDFIETIRESICKKFGKTISMGVSREKDNITGANEGYREAEVAARQKFYLGKGKAIFYKDIDFQSGISINIDEKYEELINNVGIGNNDKVQEIIDIIFGMFSKSSIIQEQYIKAFCFRIMSDIYRVVYDMNENIESIFGREDILWSKIYRFDTIPDVRQWLKNIITAVTQYIFKKRSKKNSNVIEVIIKTLEERYYEQITIDEVAKKVYLTPNYVCNIFKESVGDSIIDYLTKVRMKHAQRLLSDTPLKIYEVAEKTGFNNTSYFSIVFKNTFGMGPKDYRDMVMSGEYDEKKNIE